MSNSWRLMLHPDLPGCRQMAIDEAVYQLADPESKPLLRFYTWRRPTLSLGYFQDYKRVVSEAFCVHNKIDVVRRITGGRSVLHQYEVTYAVVASLNKVFANQSLQETYQLIGKALSLALEQLGIAEPSISLKLSPNAAAESRLPQCFVSISRYEHYSKARKIIGSAQKRSRDRFLQHGSILLDFDPYLQQGCVWHPDPEIENKIAALNRLTGRQLGFEEISSRFACAFQNVFNAQMEKACLTNEEQSLAEELEQKYNRPEWTSRKCK